MTASKLQSAKSVGGALEQHRAQAAAAGLSVISPALRLGLARLTGRLVLDTLRLLLGLLPAGAGMLHHLVPFAVTRGIVQLVKHPGRPTIAQNRLMIGLPVFALWYALVWGGIAHHHGALFAWLWTVLMPCAGVAALHYAWRVRTAGRAWWQELKMIFRLAELRRLRQSHVSVRRQLEKLKAEYLALSG